MHLVPPLDFSSPSQRSGPISAPQAAPTFGASSVQRSAVHDSSTESSGEGNEVAFLEYVTCSICHYPLQREPQRDFWITSCAHILCGSPEHQHKAQNCSYCGKKPIETFLISDELPEDLMRWLQPTRTSITTISDSLSILYFQNRELSKLVRHLRGDNERMAMELGKNQALEIELEDVKRQLAHAQVNARARTEIQSYAQHEDANHYPAQAPPSFGQREMLPPPPPANFASHIGSGSGSGAWRKRLRDDIEQQYAPSVTPPPKMSNLATPLTRPVQQLQRPSTSASTRKISQYAYQSSERSNSVRPGLGPEIRHPQPQRLAPPLFAPSPIQTQPPPIRAMPTVPAQPAYTRSVPVKLGALGSGRPAQAQSVLSTPRAARMMAPRLAGTPQRFVPGSGTENGAGRGGGGGGGSFRRASEM